MLRDVLLNTHINHADAFMSVLTRCMTYNNDVHAYCCVGWLLARLSLITCR
jgi:hypothetical protein